jgi:hypothetical protein
VQICWAMKKLYHTVSPGLVVKEGRKLGCPLTELLLGVLVHMTSRVLRAERSGIAVARALVFHHCRLRAIHHMGQVGSV